MALTKTELHGMAAEEQALKYYFDTTEIPSAWISNTLEFHAAKIGEGSITGHFDSSVYLALQHKWVTSKQEEKNVYHLGWFTTPICFFGLGYFDIGINYIRPFAEATGLIGITDWSPLIISVFLAFIPLILIHLSIKKTLNKVDAIFSKKLRGLNEFYQIKNHVFSNSSSSTEVVELAGNATAGFSVPSQD